MTPGDIGLMLWIDARRDGSRGEELADRLGVALRAAGGLPARLGMELGWIVTGLAHHEAAGGSETGERLLRESLEQLLVRNRAQTHLFRHFGARGWRRRFPNFATQIYSVLALAVVGRHGLDDRALPGRPRRGRPAAGDAAARRRLAVAVRRRARDRGGALRDLLGAPGRDGADGPVRADRGHGRPALPRRGRARAGLDPRRQRARAGPGRPREPAGAALDPPPPRARPLLARRQDRRLGRRPADAPARTARLTEPNPTDRPYHFGWVLEAWCGREDAALGGR